MASCSHALRSVAVRVSASIAVGAARLRFLSDSSTGRDPVPTPAFASAQELIGYPVVHLTVSSGQPEPLLFAYLEQVAPDGKARVLGFGRLAAAYRKEGRAPYDTMGLPWHTGLTADHAPLMAGKPVEMAFALTPTAKVIPAGQRLRLVVTGADPRQRNLAQIRIDPPPTLRLHLRRGASARLELPLRNVGESRVAGGKGFP